MTGTLKSAGWCRRLLRGMAAAALAVIATSLTFAGAANAADSTLSWPNEPPADNPFALSAKYTGITFTGRYATYQNADTWYPSWAADDSLFSPWTDGTVNGVGSSSIGSGATTGHARILGDDPMALSIQDAGLISGDPTPYGGRYPSAALAHDGVLYQGTYTLDDLGGSCGNWCAQGPFVGFNVSTDGGTTWAPPPHTPSDPLFGESGKNGGKVKLGPLHVVDFGRNMEHSPDGRAYMVGHGACDDSTRQSNWIAGDCIYLVRVTPSPETINDASAYEFFAGRAADGRAVWSHDLADIQPILRWQGHLGSAAMTYDAPQGVYLLTVSRPSDGFNNVGPFDTMIFESDRIGGPWRMVQYLAGFGTEAYFANLPSKFISADGASMWLAYSANFAGTPSFPPGSRYGLVLRELTLDRSPCEACAPDWSTNVDMPKSGAPGAWSAVSVHLTNHGVVPGGTWLSLDAPDGTAVSPAGRRFIRVAPGQTRSIRFSVRPSGVGGRQLSVRRDGDVVATGQLSVQPVTQRAALEYSDLAVDAPRAAAGAATPIHATVTNVGGKAGSEDAVLFVDGVARDSTPVTLQPGDSTRVGFSVEFDDASDLYTHDVTIGPLPAAQLQIIGPPVQVCATGVRCEAEQATLSGSAYVTSVWPGYSGSGFVAGYDRGTAVTTFRIDAPADADYQLAVRYANGDCCGQPPDRALDIVVGSGAPTLIALPSTGAWSSWATAEQTIHLAKGVNKVALACDPTQACAVNVDYVTATGAGAQAAPAGDGARAAP